MGKHISGIDRPDLEKQWANYEARTKLSAEDKALWDSSAHTIRPYVYYDKVLIAWTVIQGQPQIKEVFKATGLDVSFQDGIWMHLDATIAARRVTVNHTPRRMLPDLDIIAWVPYFNEARFGSSDWNDLAAKKNLRLCGCFKMRSSGDDLRVPLVEGQHYLSELHVFRDLWPQYRSTYF